MQLLDPHRHAGIIVALVEAPDGVVDGRFRIGDGGIEQAEIERTGQLPAQARHLAGEIADDGEDALGRLIDDRPLVGELKADPAALAKLGAEALLELGHMIADRRGADIHLRLGGSVAAILHHRGEDLEQAKVLLSKIEHAYFSM